MRRIRLRSDRANDRFREQNVTDYFDLPIQARVRAREQELGSPMELPVQYASEENDVATLSKPGNKIELTSVVRKNFFPDY